MIILPLTLEDILHRSRQSSEMMPTPLTAVEKRSASFQTTETMRASDLASEMARTHLHSLEALGIIALQPSKTVLAGLEASEILRASLEPSQTLRVSSWPSMAELRRFQEQLGTPWITGPPPDFFRPKTTPTRRPGFTSYVPRSDIICPSGTPPLKPNAVSPGQPRQASTPKRTTSKRNKSKKYMDEVYFKEVLGDVIDALRLQNPAKEPSFEEIAASLLWTEGMSPTTLKDRLKHFHIILAEFRAARPRPSRRTS